MKAILPLVLVIVILLVGGCGLFQPKNEIITKPELNTGKDISQAQKTIAKSKKEITSATEDITKETQTIKDEATATKLLLPPKGIKICDVKKCRSIWLKENSMFLVLNIPKFTFPPFWNMSSSTKLFHFLLLP